MEKEIAQGAPAKREYEEGHDQVYEGPVGDGLIDTNNPTTARYLGAESVVVHGDGWHEETHGQWPGDRLETGI